MFMLHDMHASKTLRDIAARDKRVDEYEFDGANHWMHLKSQWVNPLTDTHAICEETVAAVRSQLPTLTRCGCNDCLFDRSDLGMAPAVRLSNGLRVANFSSPHPFNFVDGTVLPACKEDRCRRLSAETREVETRNPAGFTDIQLSFELTDEVVAELQALDNDPVIDVVLAPLPIVQAARQSGVGVKARTVRMADRVTKQAHIDRFCL